MNNEEQNANGEWGWESEQLHGCGLYSEELDWQSACVSSIQDFCPFSSLPLAEKIYVDFAHDGGPFVPP